LLITVAVVCAAVSLVACQATRARRHVEPRGFLGDYSQLKESDEPGGQLVYIDRSADWSRYDSILIDSVTIWRTTETARLSAEERQQLTDMLYTALHNELSKDYAMVSHSGPTTLRLRVAITEAEGADVVANTLTTVVPQARMVSVLAGGATDTAVTVGEAAIEADLRDSMTGVRLGAMVGERAGAKSIQGLGGEWKDVENAFEYWAEMFRERLARLRAG
jgi:hypothetical protein